MNVKANTVRIDTIEVRQFDNDTLVEGLVAADFSGASIIYNGVPVVVSIAQEDDRDDEDLDVGVLLVEEVEDAPGHYRIRWRVGAKGVWAVTLRLPEDAESHPAQNFRFDADTQVNDLDDLAGVVAAIPGSADVIVDVAGISHIVVGEEWNPIWRFRHRSTLALFDPRTEAEPGVVSVEVLDSEALEVLQTVDGADVVRSGLGRYTAALEALALVGTVFLRVNFEVEGSDEALEYVIEVYVLSAGTAEAVTSGGASDLEHIYTCPSFLTDEGFNLDDISGRLRWKMIKTVSAMIDKMTQQWFNGDHGEWDMDGGGSRLIQHKQKIPIHGVTQVEVLSDRTNRRRGPWPESMPGELLSGGSGLTGALGLTSIVCHDRAIERVRSHFPDGAKNIRVTGVLGWIEGFRSVNTTAAEELTADAVSLQVADTAGLTLRMVIEILGDFDSCRAIITAVNRGTNTIYFDPVVTLGANIEAGAVVRSFGRVPRPIEDLANYLCGMALRERTSNAAGEQPADPGRVKRERTDDYEYELFPTTGAGGATSLITGNLRYEQIVREYSMPGGVMFI